VDQKQALLSKIEKNSEYIQAILDAMTLEGSYRINAPCHLCVDDDDEQKGQSL
jgi:hypothetical protein